MAAKTNRCRVLIVDDVLAVREALRYAFEALPDLDIVGEAADGEEAVAQATESPPDLVILDAELPGIDGYEVAKRLKALDVPPLIVFLTIHGDQASRRRALEVGVDAFVDKGNGWPTLLNRIRFLLDVKANSASEC